MDPILQPSLKRNRDQMEKTIDLLNLLQDSIKSRDSTDASIPQAPHQCHHCKNIEIIFHLNKRLSLNIDNDFLPYQEGTVTFPLSGVLLAAHTGCRLYCWILRLLCQSLQKLHPMLISDQASCRVKMTIILRSYYMSALVPNSFTGSNERHRSKWSLESLVGRPWEGAQILHDYQLASSPFIAEVELHMYDFNSFLLDVRDSLLVSSFQGSTDYSGLPCISAPAPIEWNKGSAKSIEFAKRRLRQCQECHKTCHLSATEIATNEPALPSRLLYLESASPSTILLIETTRLKQTIEYAILSYCWGGPQPISLSRGNCNDMLNGIAIKSLAQTVQDAVSVCKSLGVAYLWVDALCIIQNDETDEQREIGKMELYYRNSLVTICAASASGSKVGFLSSNETLSDDAESMVMTFRELDGSGEFEKFIQERDRHRLNVLPVEKSKYLAGAKKKFQLSRLPDVRNLMQPISRRAWTFQEALLSRRMLVFAFDQLYWCCTESYIGCGGFSSSERKVSVRPDCKVGEDSGCVCGTSLIRTVHDVPSDVFTLGQRSAMSTSAQWDMIVENFSARQLTEENDKLRACAAVASYFRPIFTARWPDVWYAAGLWYSAESPRSFRRQLLWTSDKPSDARRPLRYRGPSWSWVSIDGGVTVFHPRIENLFPSLSNLEILALRVECLTTLMPFGEIQNARLSISGRMRILDSVEIEASLADLNLSFDTSEDHRLQQVAPFYHLLEVIPYSTVHDSPRGLVLVPLYSTNQGGVPEFNRIGTFLCSKRSSFAEQCFKNCSKETLDVL